MPLLETQAPILLPSSSPGSVVTSCFRLHLLRHMGSLQQIIPWWKVLLVVPLNLSTSAHPLVHWVPLCPAPSPHAKQHNQRSLLKGEKVGI